MKKANRKILNNGNQAHSLSNQEANRFKLKRALSPASRWYFTGKAVGVATGIALSLLGDHQAGAQNLSSPAFANPSEVRYRDGEKRLRAIIELTSGDRYKIPNVHTERTLRQFRGWDPAQPTRPPKTDIGPGPTLRARLGDLVEISFLNKINDRQFSYTFVTDSKPGLSDFGCDTSGTTRDPNTDLFVPYPKDDKFPNCFHGSSTANIHFHGTHTSPDGLGDNVLVEVLPQLNQPDWTATFNRIFDSGKIPQKWTDLPTNYQQQQLAMIDKHDKEAAAEAKKNGLPPPESLYKKDQEMINAGLWPQYLMGAFPNFFEIPDYSSGKWKAGQAPGTHWYHSHKHGSTSLHILNGLAGALIIESSQEGGYDHVIRKFYGWGDTYGNHEKILVFQQFDTTQNLERSGPGGKGIKQVLVNGKLTPTITMAPGEVQLWRLVNATEGNAPGIIQNTVIQTKDFKFKQTAKDGVQFSPENYKNQPFLTAPTPNGMVPAGLTLAAANRADLLVQAPTTTGLATFKSGTATLFFVNVTGEPVTLVKPFPDTWAELPKFLSDLPQPGPNDITNPGLPVKFQWEKGRTRPGPTPNPPHFMINNQQFNEKGRVVDQCMPLDGLQDWVLENYTSSIAHPFHIHINPFQVIRIETPTAQNTYSTYAPKDNFIWQDVIAIPPAVITNGKITPGRVTIRQTYVDFTGTFVLHCHILAHEDRGMMQLVRVVPAANYPKGCQDKVPEHH